MSELAKALNMYREHGHSRHTLEKHLSKLSKEQQEEIYKQASIEKINKRLAKIWGKQ